MIPVNSIGDYRFRITFQIPSVARAEDGQVNPDNAWVDYATRWAAIIPLTGREYVWANQIVSEVSHRIECRYLDGITSDMRIRHSNRVFQIAGIPVDDNNMKTKLTILCRETDQATAINFANMTGGVVVAGGEIG